MKLFALALTIALSTTAAMASIPTTEAVKNILQAGTYEGRNCQIIVTEVKDSVVVTIKANSLSLAYKVTNATNESMVNELTGEVSATQSLNAPFYLNGGTIYLNIRNIEDNVIASISKILVDHKGNDASTYLDCKVSL
jgi:hypothetical protein